VATLRLLASSPDAEGHKGEVFACAFTPDSAHVLSGGWDGDLRLWEADSGQLVTALRVGPKPVPACAVAPGGRHWLCGTLDGMLHVWDAMSQKLLRTFMAHTRPVSAILFGEDPDIVVTASWDRTLMIWDLKKERDSLTLSGHEDIVAGCCYTPDERRLLSWSHDGTLRLWQLDALLSSTPIKAHKDRVNAAAVSPDGRWMAAGSRDGILKLWDLATELPMASVQLPREIRACFFLLDGQSLVIVDQIGRVAMFTLPDLGEAEALLTGLTVQCAQLAPSGQQIALGCGDGRVHVVAVDGLEEVPLVVTPTQTSRRVATPLQRLLGTSTVKQAFRCTCPVCRKSFELPKADPDQAAFCPSCRRGLRMSTVTRVQADIEEEALMAR
jgi:WD40 repeat protein